MTGQTDDTSLRISSLISGSWKETNFREKRKLGLRYLVTITTV